MPEKLTVTPWNRQPPELTPKSASSPSGRPYSPYPYRDLPKTPSEWPARTHTTPSTPASHAHQDNFHLFSYLPAELRLQIWREAMLEACSHPRVHRVRLAVTQSPNQDDNSNNSSTTNNNPPPKEPALGLQILPTPHLTTSTHATRALLSTCSEARAELLTPGATLFPDTLPLFAGGSGKQSGRRSGILRCNLAVDVLLLDALDSDLLFRIDDALHCDHHRPELLSGVRHLGLDVAPLLEEAEWGGASMLFSGAAVSPAVETALVGVVAAGVMRFLCQFRQAMDSPAVVTDLDDQEGLERLEGVKLRLLGHYVTGSRDGLELSSPERCLEVALGREPRWVQWEWVCQCLDC
ncbi:hypothetical protein C8A01DRAFT_12213 [Parachaetomium inaequale]|uniref:2EXR domain-containing protein n=1 Tax=Parachaetomium inaequale TaxID=2588326 RepID=A0AAN6PNP5_9PEZI|nr:hypothetical protein C8A01DRAFT_12213 [Parachaetomium inaequale]